MAVVHFTKMQGTGNDFILVDGRENDVGAVIAQARLLCDRRFGIGADQLLLLRPSDKADFRMQIFNADGSEVEMCGNGVRCFARYLLEHGLTSKKTLEIETPAGIITPTILGDQIRVDRGKPVLSAPGIPVRLEGEVISEPVRVDREEMMMTCVSMGNPHCVIRVDDVESWPVERIGSRLEVHPLFPNRTNVEFVQVLNEREIKVRVWERGAGETLSCGTGACAAAVASVLNHWTGQKITLHLRGGDLQVQWEPGTHVILSGPAEEVFEGEIAISSASDG